MPWHFEFDAVKSESNLAKHGIDFFHAQLLWEDDDRLEIPARTGDEQRWIVIGRIDGRLWAARRDEEAARGAAHLRAAGTDIGGGAL